MSDYLPFLKWLLEQVGKYGPGLVHWVKSSMNEEVTVTYVQPGTKFVRIGGLSGFFILGLSTYWHYRQRVRGNAINDRNKVFENAQSVHMFSTAALLAVPLTRHPSVVYAFLGTGTVLFCGTCYARALANGAWIRRVEPYDEWMVKAGRGMMMFGWLFMVL